MAHILIIEDDSSINSMLRDALGNSGYTYAFPARRVCCCWSGSSLI